MSYESWSDGGLTPLERAAGVWDLLNRECSCGACDECQWRYNDELEKKKEKLENSERFKIAAKLVARLNSNRETKLVLLQKVHLDSLDSAIVRYMAKEELPGYYAAILKSPNCIDRLVEGIFCKVCKIQPAPILAEQITNLSSSLRSNPSRLTAYDRVTRLQQFIHCTVNRIHGGDAALSIPVVPMKNALSAARLHLSIYDVIDRRPGYVAYIDSLTTATLQLEYDEPRPSTAPTGKRSWRRWRVRHLYPLSYYFPEGRRRLLDALENLDEKAPSDQFVNEALLLYAGAC